VTNPSRPFQPDKPAPLPPLPKPDPVRDGARVYRKQLTEEYKSELADLRSYAEEEWKRYRADHPFSDNRGEFVKQIIDSLAPAPPPHLPDGEAYRLSTPYEDRLRLLGENRVFDEFVKVATYRAGGQISLKALREAIVPYGPLTNDELIKILDDAGLTLCRDKVLFVTGDVEADRPVHLPNLPLNAPRPMRDLLAPEDERLSPEEY
jgi:hypothetical protein